MRKLPVVAKLEEQQGFAQLVDPGSIDSEKLGRLHNPRYVVRPLASKRGVRAKAQAIRLAVLAPKLRLGRATIGEAPASRGTAWPGYAL